MTQKVKTKKLFLDVTLKQRKNSQNRLVTRENTTGGGRIRTAESVICRRRNSLTAQSEFYKSIDATRRKLCCLTKWKIQGAI